MGDERDDKEDAPNFQRSSRNLILIARTREREALATTSAQCVLVAGASTPRDGGRLLLGKEEPDPLQPRVEVDVLWTARRRWQTLGVAEGTVRGVVRDDGGRRRGGERISIVTRSGGRLEGGLDEFAGLFADQRRSWASGGSRGGSVRGWRDAVLGDEGLSGWIEFGSAENVEVDAERAGSGFGR
jgi:hypothetical protein